VVLSTCLPLGLGLCLVGLVTVVTVVVVKTINHRWVAHIVRRLGEQQVAHLVSRKS